MADYIPKCIKPIIEKGEGELHYPDFEVFFEDSCLTVRFSSTIGENLVKALESKFSWDGFNIRRDC